MDFVSGDFNTFALNVAYTDFPHGISWTFFERTMDGMLDSFANVQIEIWFDVDFCGILSLASLSSFSLTLFSIFFVSTGCRFIVGGRRHLLRHQTTIRRHHRRRRRYCSK